MLARQHHLLFCPFNSLRCHTLKMSACALVSSGQKNSLNKIELMFSMLGVEATKQIKHKRLEVRVQLCRPRGRQAAGTGKPLQPQANRFRVEWFPRSSTFTSVVVVLLIGFFKGRDPLTTAVASRERELSACPAQSVLHARWAPLSPGFCWGGLLGFEVKRFLLARKVARWLLFGGAA